MKLYEVSPDRSQHRISLSVAHANSSDSDSPSQFSTPLRVPGSETDKEIIEKWTCSSTPSTKASTKASKGETETGHSGSRGCGKCLQSSFEVPFSVRGTSDESLGALCGFVCDLLQSKYGCHDDQWDGQSLLFVSRAVVFDLQKASMDAYLGISECSGVHECASFDIVTDDDVVRLGHFLEAKMTQKKDFNRYKVQINVTSPLTASKCPHCEEAGSLKRSTHLIKERLKSKLSASVESFSSFSGTKSTSISTTTATNTGTSYSLRSTIMGRLRRLCHVDAKGGFRAALWSSLYEQPEIKKLMGTGMYSNKYVESQLDEIGDAIRDSIIDSFKDLKL